MSSLFTSESVTCGHPDKICDQVSDALLDEALRQDSNSRVAVETAVKTGMVMVFGEMRTKAWVDTESIVREVIQKIGYTRAEYGFDYNSVAVLSSIGQQSNEIAQGVDESEEKDLGAGDQGMMFGYACTETPEYMPLPITLAHQLTHQLEKLRRGEGKEFLRPDGKAQVTVEYTDKGEADRIHTVVLSAQHSDQISLPDLKKKLIDLVITPVLGDRMDTNTILHINPTGSFIVGGPQGDAGLTGRKIIVDTYGGSCAHGGGAFSGKDPTKVDRSGAYAARHIAKNIVAAQVATKCQVQVSYAIGVVQPISLAIETFGTETVPCAKIISAITKHWDLSPSGIIKKFQLHTPIYQQTASGGHFGRGEFLWENTDDAKSIREHISHL